MNCSTARQMTSDMRELWKGFYHLYMYISPQSPHPIMKGAHLCPTGFALSMTLQLRTQHLKVKLWPFILRVPNPSTTRNGLLCSQYASDEKAKAYTKTAEVCRAAWRVASLLPHPVLGVCLLRLKTCSSSLKTKRNVFLCITE